MKEIRDKIRERLRQERQEELKEETYSKDDIIDFLSENIFALKKELEKKETIILQQEEALKLHEKLNELERKNNDLNNDDDINQIFRMDCKKCA